MFRHSIHFQALVAEHLSHCKALVSSDVSVPQPQQLGIGARSDALFDLLIDWVGDGAVALLTDLLVG